LVWTSTLDNFWTDLALQPVYLPFVHQLARHAAGYAESRPWFTAGQVLDLAAARDSMAFAPGGDEPGTTSELAARQAAGAVSATTLRGHAVGAMVGFEPGDACTMIGGKLPRVLELTEQGFYEVRPAG